MTINLKKPPKPEQFIAGPPQPHKERYKVQLTMRFDADLLQRIDAAAAGKAVSRTALFHLGMMKFVKEVKAEG
jgi:hypothetical protein